MKFRKKPVEIEAILLRPLADTSTREVPGWLVDAIISGGVLTNDDGSADVVTLEGKMHAEVGDWIIRGVKGELYPCKPDIFALTYEVVV